MRTASGLSMCGYESVLSRGRIRTPSQLTALRKGEDFHLGVQRRLEGRDHEPKYKDTATWLSVLFSSWSPPPGTVCEYALGLSPAGRHVAVKETEPHVYVPLDKDETLLTAGRMDLGWVEGRVAVTADLKTGRTHVGPPGQRLQNLALGFSWADKCGSEAIRLGIYYARTGQWEWSDDINLDSADAASLWGALETAASLDESPSPGPWCAGCWESGDCDYREQLSA